MDVDSIDPDKEFTPSQAFMYALDDAIVATVLCLAATGMSDKLIWSAFRQAIKLVSEAAREIDDGELSRCLPIPVAAR